MVKAVERVVVKKGVRTDVRTIDCRLLRSLAARETCEQTLTKQNLKTNPMSPGKSTGIRTRSVFHQRVEKDILPQKFAEDRNSSMCFRNFELCMTKQLDCFPDRKQPSLGNNHFFGQLSAGYEGHYHLHQQWPCGIETILCNNASCYSIESFPYDQCWLPCLARSFFKNEAKVCINCLSFYIYGIFIVCFCSFPASIGIIH